jgi:hypothetical protein
VLFSAALPPVIVGGGWNISRHLPIHLTLRGHLEHPFGGDDDYNSHNTNASEDKDDDYDYADDDDGYGDDGDGDDYDDNAGISQSISHFVVILSIPLFV